MSYSSSFTPIELFAAEDMGRRRHWSDEDKIRIVEESFRGHRQGSATARRHGISRSLLSSWRRAYREGTLGGSDLGGDFVPLRMAEAAPVQGALEPTDVQGSCPAAGQSARACVAGWKVTLPDLLG